jgi:hypothetical protein
MKHNVVHLKVFCCVTYAHVPDELRKKLDNKGNKIIFVGYYEDTKAYKLYDPIAIKVIISHDVQFVENEAWNGSISKKIKIIDSMEHEDTKEKVIQTPCTSQCTVPFTTAMQITMQNTSVRSKGAQLIRDIFIEVTY